MHESSSTPLPRTLRTQAALSGHLQCVELVRSAHRLHAAAGIACQAQETGALASAEAMLVAVGEELTVVRERLNDAIRSVAVERERQRGAVAA